MAAAEYIAQGEVAKLCMAALWCITCSALWNASNSLMGSVHLFPCDLLLSLMWPSPFDGVCMEVEVNPSPQLPQLSCEFTTSAVIRWSLSQLEAPDD